MQTIKKLKMNDKLIITIILTIFIGWHSTNAQSILMEEDIRKYDIYKPRKGPNLRNFTHLYMNYGLIVEIPDYSEAETETKLGSSHTLAVGYRYKLKLTDIIAFGYDISYSYYSYYLKQTEQKTFPNTILHSSEKIRFSNIGFEAYLRLNINKRRGNYVGNYLDIGGYANWMYQAKHIYHDKEQLNQLYHANNKKVVLKDLQYTKSLNYGIKCRIGFNRFAIFGTYRLSDLIKPEYKTTIDKFELPQFAIGVELGFF